MYCQNCGNEVLDKNSKCDECGSSPLKGTIFCQEYSVPLKSLPMDKINNKKFEEKFNSEEIQKKFKLFTWLYCLGLPLCFLIIGLPLVIFAIVLSFILHYKAWDIIQDGEARTTPQNAIGFLFIPFYSFYWAFVSYSGLAKDMNNYIKNNNIQAPLLSENLFLAYCILIILSFIPLIGMFVAIVLTVIYFMLILEMKNSMISIIELKKNNL